MKESLKNSTKCNPASAHIYSLDARKVNIENININIPGEFV